MLLLPLCYADILIYVVIENSSSKAGTSYYLFRKTSLLAGIRTIELLPILDKASSGMTDSPAPEACEVQCR